MITSTLQNPENPNDLTIPVGDGLFRDLGLAHAKIEELKRQQANNPVIQNAFKLIEDADKGFQSDIQYLTDFLYQRRNNGALAKEKIVNMICEDINSLKKHRNKFTTGQNPEAWCIDRLLGDSVLEKAKAMINAHPELIQGRLPKPLKQYKSREVSALKTALAYCALARDPRNFVMKNIKGAYRLKLSPTQERAIGDMHIVRGLDSKYLYAPLNSYVLRASQIENLNNGAKVMMGDCSGYVTNVLKRLFGEEYPRLFTYDLACFHDYKMRQRQDMSKATQGPIVTKQGVRSSLTARECDNADAWYKGHHQQYHYLANRLQTVSELNNIKPGDLLVWRNKSSTDGRGQHGVNGHIGIVLDADPAHNSVTLMENTSGGAYGIGIKNVPIVFDSATTRILRPKIG
ncbi:MAG: hypothetical protein JSR17_13640 [Proteobacteria bacterium]|nr:hypothetical protein [Pseudomonadota bacterium]